MSNVMPYEEMVRLIAAGRDSRGEKNDLLAFGLPGKKSLEELNEELEGQDVTLHLNNNGRVIRTALSVKIFIPRYCFEARKLVWLRETGRSHRGVETVHPAPKLWGVSGTRKRGETARNAARREILEELGYSIDPTELEILNASDQVDVHESTVYPGVLSASIITWVRWFWGRPEFDPNGYLIRDGETAVQTRWLEEP